MWIEYCARARWQDKYLSVIWPPLSTIPIPHPTPPPPPLPPQKGCVTIKAKKQTWKSWTYKINCKINCSTYCEVPPHNTGLPSTERLFRSLKISVGMWKPRNQYAQYRCWWRYLTIGWVLKGTFLGLYLLFVVFEVICSAIRCAQITPCYPSSVVPLEFHVDKANLESPAPLVCSLAN